MSQPSKVDKVLLVICISCAIATVIGGINHSNRVKEDKKKIQHLMRMVDYYQAELKRCKGE